MAARARGGSDTMAKPRFDAYGGMLLLSLAAMIGATVFLFLDYSEYQGKPPAAPGRPAGAAAPAPAPGGGGPAAPPGAPPAGGMMGGAAPGGMMGGAAPGGMAGGQPKGP
jgi:hypothetical protein